MIRIQIENTDEYIDITMQNRIGWSCYAADFIGQWGDTELVEAGDNPDGVDYITDRETALWWKEFCAAHEALEQVIQEILDNDDNPNAHGPYRDALGRSEAANGLDDGGASVRQLADELRREYLG